MHASGSMDDRPNKRQRGTDYGKNPLGIIIAKPRPITPADAVCNICSKPVVPGQRIIVDTKYSYPESWWNHLECAGLHLLDEDQIGECTASATATGYGHHCAWCAKWILPERHMWKGHWMGWIHSTCDVGELHDFKRTLASLQQKFPKGSMPEECHWWVTPKQLQGWANVHHPLQSQPIRLGNQLMNSTIKMEPSSQCMRSASLTQQAQPASGWTDAGSDSKAAPTVSGAAPETDSKDLLETFVPNAKSGDNSSSNEVAADVSSQETQEYQPVITPHTPVPAARIPAAGCRA